MENKKTWSVFHNKQYKYMLDSMVEVRNLDLDFEFNSFLLFLDFELWTLHGFHDVSNSVNFTPLNLQNCGSRSIVKTKGMKNRREVCPKY